MAKKKSTRKSAKQKKAAPRKSATKKSAPKKAAAKKAATKKSATKKKSAKKAAKRAIRSLWRPVCTRHGRLGTECMSRQQALAIATDHALADPRCEGDAEKC